MIFSWNAAFPNSFHFPEFLVHSGFRTHHRGSDSGIESTSMEKDL